MIPYEKIVFPKRIHYSLFWIIIGVLLFLLQEIIFRCFGEEAFFGPRIVMTFVLVSGLPIVYIYASHSLQQILSNLGKYIVFPGDNTINWSTQKTIDIFSFRNHWAKFIAIFVTLLISVLILTLDLPFRSNTLLLILTILVMCPVWFFGGHGVYVAPSFLMLLINISNCPIKSPFYKPAKSVVSPLLSLYSRISLVALVLYLLHVLAIWLSPYSNTPQMIAWILFSGFFPFAMFLLSFTYTHKIIRNIKESNIDQVNEHLQIAYHKFSKSPSKENAEALEKIMAIQKSLENMREWPFELGGVFTFIITLLLPLTQLILAALNVIKP